MIDGRVYFDKLDVADEIFTVDKMDEWESDLMVAYHEILAAILDDKDASCDIRLAMNVSLLNDTIVDAVLGLKKITQSTNNTVGEPNTFKIVEYIMYWLLRHKPVQIYCGKNVRVEDVFVKHPERYSAEEFEQVNNELAWKIKHVNEHVVVAFALSHIFNKEVEVLTDKDFTKLKKIQGISLKIPEYI